MDSQSARLKAVLAGSRLIHSRFSEEAQRQLVVDLAVVQTPVKAETAQAKSWPSAVGTIISSAVHNLNGPATKKR